MTAPPGTTPTFEPRVEHISAESAIDLSTRTRQMRYLVSELGVTRPQAHHMIRAYEQDVADAIRIGNTTRRSDDSFLAWLMRQVPNGARKRTKVRACDPRRDGRRQA